MQFSLTAVRPITFATEEEAESAAREALRSQWEPDSDMWDDFDAWLWEMEYRQEIAETLSVAYGSALWEQHGLALGSDLQGVRYLVENVCANDPTRNEAHCVEVLPLIRFFRDVCFNNLGNRELVLRTIQEFGNHEVRDDTFSVFTLWCKRWGQGEGRLMRRYILRVVERLRDTFGIYDYDDDGELIPEDSPTSATGAATSITVATATMPPESAQPEEEEEEPNTGPVTATGEGAVKDAAIVLHTAKVSGLVRRSFRFLGLAWEMKEDAIRTYGPLRRNKGEGYGGVVVNLPGPDAENFAAFLLARFGTSARQQLLHTAEKIAAAADNPEAQRAAAPHPDLVPPPSARHRASRRRS